jgi:hypothetical protein
MAVRFPRSSPWRYIFYDPIRLPSFEGGLNLRDAPTELAFNESPNLMNVQVDERGGITKRLGYGKWNASAAANLFTEAYYSRVGDKLLFYSAADGKLYSDPGTGVLTARRTWTTGSQISIIDFAGKIYAIHPTDGLYSSSDLGVTWVLVTATSGTVPKGDLLAVWQNKLWVSGDPNATTTIYFSAAGDATKWDAADGAGSNALRDGRDAEAPIVALFGATGANFQTKPILLVYKRTSTHWVSDPSTGAYITIDAANGASGKNAVTTVYGRIYSISTAGVFETDGQGPLIPIAAKLDPLFGPTAINKTLEAGFCAGVQQGRVKFSIARANATANDLCLEYHPIFQAFTTRTDAMRVYLTYPKTSDTLIGASPTVTGQLYSLNSAGGDDSTAIHSWFATRVLEPLGGLEARLQKVQVKLAGTASLQVIPDYGSSADSTTISGAQGTGFRWDVDGVWDVSGAWGDGGSPEGYATLWPRKAARAFQFRIDETSTLTRGGNLLLDGSYQPTVGAWSMYGIDGSASQLAIV